MRREEKSEGNWEGEKRVWKYVWHKSKIRGTLKNKGKGEQESGQRKWGGRSNKNKVWMTYPSLCELILNSRTRKYNNVCISEDLMLFAQYEHSGHLYGKGCCGAVSAGTRIPLCWGAAASKSACCIHCWSRGLAPPPCKAWWKSERLVAVTGKHEWAPGGLCPGGLCPGGLWPTSLSSFPGLDLL